MSARPDPRQAHGRSEEPTVRIDRLHEEVTIRQFRGDREPVEEATSATLLDDAVWGAPGAGRGAPVPAPRGRGARRRLRPAALAAALAAAVLGGLLWQRTHPPLAVTGVAVRSDAGGPGCDRTVTVSATLLTDGGAGTVEYRWLRSDGGVSGPLRQTVERGVRQTEVTLRWSFDGPGTVTATAELEVLSPGRVRSATTFTYACR
ncbi:hypothetical protein [Kitasatospora sp. NPDC088346]|uniref:hypothetical protein n=1 Tax=Kitasatospora sp. NPDC088346 TaxID=3364073 RepID=UPI0038214A69